VPSAYLSICSAYRDHAEYLREWIEFHRLVGVERFFLYDNESADDHLDVLAPYIGEGIVTVHDWPSPASVERGVSWNLIGAFDDCIARHGGESRWIGFLDIDEFLFAVDGRSLSELLTGYERWPGLSVSRLDYGPSGHEAKPPGLVSESYFRRKSYPPGAETVAKSIVNPSRVARCFNAHTFIYKDGFAVDENEEALIGPPYRKIAASTRTLRINHYATKSMEEYERKQEQWRAAGMDVPTPPRHWFESLETDYDDSIGVFLPRLRQAVGNFENG
jgi:hypothetical protein